MRTTGKVILDYNPSDEYHWIYDKVLSRENCIFIKSTYLDNPFLDKDLITEIEALQDIDDNYWKIYGLGEKGESAVTIYTNWDIIAEFPEDNELDDIVYGMDFGFNHSSVVLKVGIRGRDIYIDEMLYQNKLTNGDLIDKLKEIIPEDKRDISLLKADSAEPDRIEEINRAGFWCEGARKGPGSIKDGIDTVKRFNIHITERSNNTIKEEKGYKWKVDKKTGQTLDEPVKFMDHAQDAKRYAIGDMEQAILKFLKGDANVGVEREMAMDDRTASKIYAESNTGDDRDTQGMDW